MCKIIEIVKNASPESLRTDIIDIEDLLLKGENINGRDALGLTAIHWAAFTGNLQLLSELILLGADPKIQDNKLYTPMHYACLNGHIYVVEYLLFEHTISLKNKTLYKNTGLMLAAMNGHTQVVHFLLSQDSSCCHDANEKGETALHLAAANNHYETAEILLKYGSYIDARNLKGDDPLDIAEQLFPEKQIVTLLSHANYLLTYAQQLNPRKHTFSKALDCCSFKSRADGNTILHLAVIHKDIALIKLALKHNINLFLKNHCGLTAFSYAESDPKLYILLLIKKGFDIILEQDTYTKNQNHEKEDDVFKYISEQLIYLSEKMKEVYDELNMKPKLLSKEIREHALLYLIELMQSPHLKDFELENNEKILHFIALLKSPPEKREPLQKKSENVVVNECVTEIVLTFDNKKKKSSSYISLIDIFESDNKFTEKSKTRLSI